MNKQLIFSVIILALAITGAWLFFGRQTQPIIQEPARSGETLNNEAACIAGGSRGVFISEVVEGPFRQISDFSAGGAEITGRAISREEEFFDDRVKLVYLEISRVALPVESTGFFDYFADLARQGNSINFEENGNLFFKLGELEGNIPSSFTSTAAVSTRAAVAIQDSLTKGNNITLAVRVPVYAGAGAPSNFSFACSIRVAE